MKTIKTLAASALIASLAATASFANAGFVTDRDRAEGTAMQTVTTGAIANAPVQFEGRDTVLVGRSVTLSIFGGAPADVAGFANDLR